MNTREKWFRCSITFMGSGVNADDCRHKLRLLIDGMPLRDLRVAADPMSEGEILRALDRESSKQIIDADTDSGGGVLAGIMGMPARVIHPHDQGAHIFPDDHPLAPYERLALQQGDEAAVEKLKELSE